MQKKTTFLLLIVLLLIQNFSLVALDEAGDIEKIERRMIACKAINSLNWVDVSHIGTLVPVSEAVLKQYKKEAHALQHQGAYQVIFDFARPFYCEKEVFNNGSILELSFPGMQLSDFSHHDIHKKFQKIKLLKKVEVHKVKRPFEGIMIRLVFYDQKVLVKFNKLREPNRLLLDIYSKERLRNLKNIDPSVLRAIQQKKALIRPARIVLDAGHGGHDLGAVDQLSGIKEKDLTIDITRRVKKLLVTSGHKVFLTRAHDEFVSLLHRAEFTAQCNADAYVSIHVNASPLAKASGIETYYLDGKKMLLPQTKDQFLFSESVQDRELIAFAESCLDSKIAASRKLSDVIHTKLLSVLRGKYEGIVDRQIRGGTFCGLIRSSLPAILMEVGFLSNPVDRKYLCNEQGRQDVAQAIFEGIVEYLGS